MTQLVQLQSIADELAANGRTVFAISNDPVEVLADFAATHDIDFPLLSDEGSAVIRSFGIMNQLIEPDEGRSMRWYGIPYPGTYYIDADGLVMDKDFQQHHARRASGVAVLARALGRSVESDAGAQVHVDSDEVAVQVGLSDPALQLEMISDVVVEIELPDGKHVYAPGAPKQFTPLSIEVAAAGVRVSEPQWPTAEPLTMSELQLTAPTYQGRVRVIVPIATTSEIARLGHDIPDSIDLSVTSRFQMCDEVTCGLPQSVQVVLTVPLQRLVEPDGLSIYAERVEAIEAESGETVR